LNIENLKTNSINNIKLKNIMKNSIKLSALFLLLSAGIFATTSANATDHPVRSEEKVTVSAMQKGRGVYVNVLNTDSHKSYVMVFDQEDNILLKDFLPNEAAVTKGYVLTDLDNGNYTIAVISNNEVVKKKVHVYLENNQKTFFFMD
jgi:hypothetical protein